MRRTTHEASALSSTRSHQVMFLLSANTNCNWDDGAFALSSPLLLPSPSLHPVPRATARAPGTRNIWRIRFQKPFVWIHDCSRRRGGARGGNRVAAAIEPSNPKRGILAFSFHPKNRRSLWRCYTRPPRPPIYFATVTIRIWFYKVKCPRAHTFRGIRGLSITEGGRGGEDLWRCSFKSLKSLCSFRVVIIWRL